MRRGLGVGAAVAVLLVASIGALATHSSGGTDAALVVASTTTTQATALPAPTPPPAPPTTPPPQSGGPAPPSGPPAQLKASDGRAYGKAIPFNSSIPVPTELTFVLVIGSDARPGQPVARSNGDSIHLLAVNPTTREGTIVGFPRDSWIDLAGQGRGKLTTALARGGPSLMVDAVRRLTGLPIHYYALTGFEGLSRMVDDLGGVDVLVNRRMADRNSGAFFEQGWHHLSGAQALALSRNRHDTTNGDFGRSENHGSLMLAALGKMRSEVGDDGGIRRWVDVLLRHTSLDVAPDRLPRLAALARNLDPARIRNVVLPGRIGYAGAASVVYLDPGVTNLFTDLRDDAVIGASSQAPPDVAATSTTTAPAGAAPGAAPDASTTTTTAGPGLLPPILRPGG